MFGNAIYAPVREAASRRPDDFGALRRAMTRHDAADGASSGGRPGGDAAVIGAAATAAAGGGFGGFGFGGPGGGPRGRGRKARRGDIRTAALLLLAEEPRNGYQIMQEVEERSDGVWRPSPGSVYPALAQLEDEGLIRSEESRRAQAVRADRRRARAARAARRAEAGALGADERRRQRRRPRAGHG